MAIKHAMTSPLPKIACLAAAWFQFSTAAFWVPNHRPYRYRRLQVGAPNNVVAIHAKAARRAFRDESSNGIAHKVECQSTPFRKLDLKLLLIDHYDSFTYNLVDLLSQYCLEPPIVVASDCAERWEMFWSSHQKRHDTIGTSTTRPFDGVILSPGPGHPNDEKASFSRDVVRKCSHVPVLGVCLGHQILGQVYGATIGLAPEPVHGQVKDLLLVQPAASEDPLWLGIEQDPLNSSSNIISVMRYHSLQVSDLDATNLIRTAVSSDAHSVLMAMRHQTHPHFGVQFHPESIGTQEIGPTLLRNFLHICVNNQQRALAIVKSTVTSKAIPRRLSHQQRQDPCETQNNQWSVLIHKVPSLPPNGANMQPIDVMEEIIAGQDFCYWLDSSRFSGQDKQISILGASRRRLEYWEKEEPIGLKVFDDVGSFVREQDILSYLDAHYRVPLDSATTVSFDETDGVTLNLQQENILLDQLPFSFRGGHVGYLGYEIRHDTMQRSNDGSKGLPLRKSCNTIRQDRNVSSANVPTAAFLWADRSFVYDHDMCDWYLVGVVSSPPIEQNNCSTIDWMRSMSKRLQRGRSSSTVAGGELARGGNKSTVLTPSTFVPNRSQETYQRNFEDCIQHIRNGDSYELCLTNQFETRLERQPGMSPFGLYKILRQRNPAPYSAFMNWNTDRKSLLEKTVERSSAFAICCSSPERFLSVQRKQHPQQSNAGQPLQSVFEVEAKPIKGTIARVLPSDGRQSLTVDERAQDEARAQTLQSSIKDRSENLMIVDLLRNDLSRVCVPGSVHVPKLLAIESFETVHQMVSTIRGTLPTTTTDQGGSSQKSSSNMVDLLRACFPGGSMTGAPKCRTMELLDALEEGVSRGPYSGCLGYLSLNGCMDMNIIIRSAIVTPGSSFHVENEKEEEDSGDADPAQPPQQQHQQQQQQHWNVRVGAGGAITALSHGADEYAEMMLKASVVTEAVQEWAATATLISGTTLLPERNEVSGAVPTMCTTTGEQPL